VTRIFVNNSLCFIVSCFCECVAFAWLKFEDEGIEDREVSEDTEDSAPKWGAFWSGGEVRAC